MMNNDNHRIKDAMDSIEPSDGAKERMLVNIRKKVNAQDASSARKKRTGRTAWTKWAAMAACFALIVMTAMTYLGKSDTLKKPQHRYNDGIIGNNPFSQFSDYGSDDGVFPAPAESEAVGSPTAKYGHSHYEDFSYYVLVRNNGDEYSAGMLTAGEWKDAESMSDWSKKISANEPWGTFVRQRGLNTANYVKVTVTNGEQKCFNAEVALTDGENTLFTAKTDIHGCAYLFYSINGETTSAPQVKVGTTEQKVDGNTEITIDATDAGIEVTALDLMLMVDTTGSMGDELEYLKTELADMVQRISKENQALSIRVSVNFYRDKGDEYIVKYFDFRENINECLNQIKRQHAGGGDDYPEAVHAALENAVSGHTWRENAVKLCFLVLDAPPHSEQEVQGVNSSLRNSVLKAAELGIRIIPVASSGVNEETEFLLRSYALITGGTYVFLTNDSGIGLDHKDPDIDEDVTIELLNDCMVRIACEYCGIYSGEKVPYTPPQAEYHQ